MSSKPVCIVNVGRIVLGLKKPKRRHIGVISSIITQPQIGTDQTANSHAVGTDVPIGQDRPGESKPHFMEAVRQILRFDGTKNSIRPVRRIGNIKAWSY